MQLETALRNSTSGLFSHGQAISVVGDNVANVNTTGYRRSRIEFGDIIADGQGTIRDMGWRDGGDGVMVDSVRSLHIAGTIEDTGRTLDVAIEGGGFFVLGTPEVPSYSRSGIFNLNPEGFLVAPDGSQVLGFAAGAENFGEGDLVPLQVGALENLVRPTTELALSGNLSSTLPETEIPQNPASFQEINSSASFSHYTTVVDSLGRRNDVMLAFFKTGDNSWTVQGYFDNTPEGQEAGAPVQVGSTNLNFDQTGQLPEGGEAAIQLNLPFGDGAAAGAVAVDLRGFQQTAQLSSVSGTTSNGVPAEGVQDLEIDSEGRINARLASGSLFELGRIALADFVNRDGLTRVGEAQYLADLEAGERTVGAPGTGDLGSLRMAALERSNVDIQEEFVNLVVYQRGYQANSQAFSTTNQLLEQTIQLLG